jgi:hypothetical protein
MNIFKRGDRVSFFSGITEPMQIKIIGTINSELIDGKYYLVALDWAFCGYINMKCYKDKELVFCSVVVAHESNLTLCP